MGAEAESIAGQGAPTVRPGRRNGWYESAAAGRYVLARHWPPRFDIHAETRLPNANLKRLALQVRQDLWRELKDLRGFSPVVEVSQCDQGLSLVAGGRLNAAAPSAFELRISALLDNPANRERWLSWARGRTS
ncbi:MAG: hypothetical protein RLN70_11220 [Rhodospirillaceae bacterium]